MSSIKMHIANEIAEIKLNRPDKKNALRNEDWAVLKELAGQISDQSARCAIISGQGGAFCSGWDLAGARADKIDAQKTIENYINPALLALREINIPTIAAVEGVCLGGGFGIAMACDIILGAQDAVFGSPFRNIGIMIDAGGHYALREKLGHHKASQLIYTGKIISGSEAYRLGLICEVYPPAELMTEVRAMAAHIASGPTQAFIESKAILHGHADYSSSLQQEAQAQGRVFQSQDAAEGLLAFQKKTKPVFSGK